MTMGYDLRLEQVLEAAAEVVFDAFTDPDAQKELYGHAPDWIVDSACELRVGGRWTIVFGAPGSAPDRETNLFRVVERPRRLIYRSTMSAADRSGVETEVEAAFEQELGRTRLTIAQRGFPTAALRDEYAAGWASILEGLGRIVGSHPSASLPATRRGHEGS
jgi:uncharacterized protein YndB with AHSA1/START domain